MPSFQNGRNSKAYFKWHFQWVSITLTLQPSCLNPNISTMNKRMSKCNIGPKSVKGKVGRIQVKMANDRSNFGLMWPSHPLKSPFGPWSQTDFSPKTPFLILLLFTLLGGKNFGIRIILRTVSNLEHVYCTSERIQNIL